ncbi:MAG: hypothetical protein JSU77_06665 [Fidelibacterota bacterium]|nr:MAG: hypothetical protein JSU77_06665 [Candidatus Neomarinimicrobiota bacterium]
MRKLVVAFLIVAAISLIPRSVTGQSVSVIITEKTVNDFLAVVGPVKGKGTGAQKIKYDWTVTESRVDFEPGTAGFNAKVKIKTKIITFDEKVTGRLTVDYDASANKIRMQVVEARFSIVVRILGKKVKLATVDISKYYQPRFEFNGPEPIQDEVEVDVGGGTKRRVRVTAGSRQIMTEKDQLRVSVNLTYNAL